MNIVFFYTLISVLIAVVDISTACLAFAKKDNIGRHLGFACTMAAVVTCSYLVTIRTDDYFINSVFSSIYFAGISVTLNALVGFVFLFTTAPRTKVGSSLMKLTFGYMFFDIIVFVVNPFKDIAISYKYIGGVIAKFSYEMKPLFIMHLCYSYFMIAAVLFLLILAAVRFAREYKKQYIICALAMIIIVVINAIFLFTINLGDISSIDVSVLLYNLAAIFFYWACFAYPKRWIDNVLKNSIFESLEMGIVLFGHNEKMLFCNDKIHSFMPDMDFNSELNLDEFVKRQALDFNKELAEEDYLFQWYRDEESGFSHPFFCDFKSLKDNKGRALGSMFIFRDAVMESDPMTGFHNLEPFSANPNKNHFEYPVVVTCCDINGLSVINNTYGRTAGDQLISELADRFRQEFPVGTYFIRGTDANMIALSNNATEKRIIEIMSCVRKNFSGTFQYSVVTVGREDRDIVSAIEKAESNVATWKLMDKESIRSDTLNSLISALKECDPDTEAHVLRTQNMGIALSRRVGLTDNEEVNLALLCVLHDIGKIGIPLEILNKPGRLNDEEWDLMKTHVEKGFEIAMSSVDYAPIAKAIRHHHERWDGEGYPDGLSKETIPLLSRFISVIDSYDAMISDRPYKKAMTKEEAVAELLRNAGTQFDPKIVSEFVQLITEGDPHLDMDIFNIKSYPDENENRPNSYNRIKPLRPGNEEVYAIPYVKYSLDRDNHIIKFDEKLSELTGYEKEDIELMHMTQGDLIPERNRVLYSAMVSEQLGRHQMAYFEHPLLKKNGSEINVICMGRKYYDSAAKEERSEILVFDISKTNAASNLYNVEKKRAENRLEAWEETFRKDSMTGLFNHSAFVSEVELRILENSYRTLLLMIDVDDFKGYNDRYGHKSGDEFLITVADAIHQSLRETDISGRLGGDEFAAAIFFPTDVSEDTIRERAEETFRRISDEISKAKNATTVSVGVAVSNDETNNFVELYEIADKALYRSKDNGRNQLSWWEDQR